MDITQFLNQLAQSFIVQYNERLVTDGFTGEELQDNQATFEQFLPVAVGLMVQHGGIQIPGTDGEPIPFDEKTGEQLLILFSEGVFYALKKALELKITADLKVVINTENGPAEGSVKQFILQSLAMDLYGQAAQVVASTHGQENTPEFQFTIDQQIDMIQQTSESGILYYINEFEKQNGPIDNLREGAEEESELFSDGDIEAAEELSLDPEQNEPEPEPEPEEEPITVPLPIPVHEGSTRPGDIPDEASSPLVPTPIVKQATVNTPTKPASKGPSKHDKYAAVSLLLTKLKDASRRQKILSSFNPEERELIAYYIDPKNIVQNLDITCVQSHLKHFAGLLQSGKSELKSDELTAIESVIEQVPEDELLMWSMAERPRLKQFIMHYLPVDESVLKAAGITNEQDFYFSENLPPRLEKILSTYLKNKFKLDEKSADHQNSDRNIDIKGMA